MIFLTGFESTLSSRLMSLVSLIPIFANITPVKGIPTRAYNMVNQHPPSVIGNRSPYPKKKGTVPISYKDVKI